MAKSLLICRDKKEPQLLLSESLCAQGYTVYNSQNVEQFAQVVERTPPDAIIIDHSMKESEAVALVNSIPKQEHEIPVFVMSGPDQLRSFNLTNEHHAAGFIPGTYKLSDVSRLLDTSVAQNSAQSASKKKHLRFAAG